MTRLVRSSLSVEKNRMPHRTQILKLLAHYQPVDDAEIEFKPRMIEFAFSNEHCFERSLSVGHFTGSSWLLSKDGSKALLMHHRKLDRWFQLGGHADGESDLLAVAIKEAQEESGITSISSVSPEIFDIDVHELPATSKDAAHLHYDVRFLLQVTSDEEFVLNSESKELRWISKNASELPTSERSVTRMFEKWESR